MVVRERESEGKSVPEYYRRLYVGHELMVGLEGYG